VKLNLLTCRQLALKPVCLDWHSTPR